MKDTLMGAHKKYFNQLWTTICDIEWWDTYIGHPNVAVGSGRVIWNAVQDKSLKLLKFC